MRRVHRIVLLVGLLAPLLAGCADFDMDKLDIFGLNEKKKLPGDRKDVFPQGVPGVTQGIPPEYLRSNQPSADAVQTLEAQPAAATAPDQKSKTAAVEQEEPKPKPKRKPKPQTAVRQPTQVTVQRQRQDQGGAQQQPAAWPDQSQQQPQQAQQGQAPWPSAGQSSSAPWPSAPAPGTFSR